MRFWVVLIFLVQVTGALGSIPKRIISLSPDLTENIYALGLQKKLVATVDHSDFPKEARSKPSVGSFISPNLEKILALKPDFILCRKGGTPRSLIDFLKKRGIEILCLPGRNETDIADTFRAFGKKFSVSNRAKTLIDDMTLQIKKLQGRERKKRILIQIEETPLMVAGSNTLPHRAIELAGGINAAKDYIGYPKLLRETIFKLKPDIIIIPTTKGQKTKFRRMQRSWKKWNTKTTLINGDLISRATPRFIDGVHRLADIIQ